MHGRKQKDRAKAGADPAQAKYRRLRELLQTALQCRSAGDTSPASMDLAAKLLCVNPSICTLWSLRRLGAQRRMAELPAGPASAPARRALVADELALSEAALSKGNVKSHEAWSHRAWVVEALGERGALADLDKELALCAKLLSADERNFHALQYRRVVARLAGHGAGDDLAFASSLVESNFSNHSAWHLKRAALQRCHAHRGGVPCAVLRAEFELVNNAIFTEPDDQSGWMYHRWLLDATAPRTADDDVGERAAIIREQAGLVTELHELEEHRSKWAILALVRINALKRKHFSLPIPVPSPNVKKESGEAHSDAHLFALLRSLDPAHANAYDHMAVLARCR